MNGIPLSIRRGGQLETVYLSTRRSGERGAKMSQAKREYRVAQRRCAHCLQETALIARKAEALAARGEPCEGELDRLALSQDQAAAAAQAAAEGALAHATELVRLSLAECHGADAEAIMDCLTDRQLHQCVGIIETGDLPEDFFPSRATPPSASDTLQPGADITGHSSGTATPGPTLKAGG
jgi:hypothetical protein